MRIARRLALGVVASFAMAAALTATSGTASADYGKAADLRDVRDAVLRTWTAFGRDPNLVAKAVTVTDVTISSDYALCTFVAGTLGGQALFQSQRGAWVKLYQTGGVMSSVNLRDLVPRATADDLAEHNGEVRRNDAFLLGRR